MIKKIYTISELRNHLREAFNVAEVGGVVVVSRNKVKFRLIKQDGTGDVS